MQAIFIFILCLAFFCQSTVADNESVVSEEVDEDLNVESVTDFTIYASTQNERHKTTIAKTTTENTSLRPTRSPIKRPAFGKPGRENIEKFLTDFFVFENVLIHDHKVGTDNEIYEGKGLGYDDYIFHSMIGSIVQAGPKTRAGNTCHGLKKLYQYFNQTDQTHRLTLNYLDVNNIGDRQPIGLCAPNLNVCGADLPLYVYSGIHLTPNKTKTNYFFATTSTYKFTPDKQNYKLVNNNKPLCYIYSRSEERQKEDELTSVNQNVRLRNLAKEIVPVYWYSDGVVSWYSLNSTYSDGTFKGHVFNVIKNTSYIANRCADNHPVLRLTYDQTVSPQFKYSYAFSTNFTDFEDLKKHSQWKYLAENHNLLGFGIGKRCGGRINYDFHSRKSRENMPPTVYVGQVGREWGPEYEPYRNGHFSSV